MNKILKQVLFLLGFVFIALGVRAQDRALDSLKNELIIHKKRDNLLQASSIS